MSNWLAYIVMFIVAAAGSFFGSYLRKKGENIATKEDIAEITKRVEEVRSQFNTQLETHKASLELSNQLKLAALDERLKKHQEAYTLWFNLRWSLRDEKDIDDIILKCQEWWIENCLYLGSEARSAFHSAYILAGNFRHIKSTDEIKKWFKDIEDAGEKLVEAVELPTLGDDETRIISTNPEDSSTNQS